MRLTFLIVWFVLVLIILVKLVVCIVVFCQCGAPFEAGVPLFIVCACSSFLQDTCEIIAILLETLHQPSCNSVQKEMEAVMQSSSAKKERDRGAKEIATQAGISPDSLLPYTATIVAAL